MNKNLLYVLMILTSLSLCGCSMDVNLLGSKVLPSLGDNNGPTTTLPMGNFTLAINKSIGKNKWVDLVPNSYEVRSGIIDNAKNSILMSYGALVSYDVNGNLLRRVDLPTATYMNWSNTRPAMVQDSSGNIYMVSRPNSNASYDQGLLKISPAGVITHYPLTGGTVTAGATDMALVNVNGVDELHITPFVMSSATGSQVEVYDLNGVYQTGRDYFALGSGYVPSTIAQNPVTKKIYVSNNTPGKLAVFLQDGTPDTPSELDFTSFIPNFGEVNFDASGRLYLTTFADGGNPSFTDYGVSVFDITGGTPSLLRTLRSATGHDKTYSIAVSPDGNSIMAVNWDNPNDIIDELWELSGTSYQFTKLYNSRGDGADDFNSSGTFGTFALDKSENLYIDDNNNKRIKVYTSSGTLKYSFSTANAGITNWTEHFVTLNSDQQVVTGGYDWQTWTPSVAKVYIQIRDKTGTQLSAAMIDFTSVNYIPKFAGIDSDDQLWFDDTQTLFRVNLSGAITKTIAYGSNPALMGVSGAALSQVVGDKIYYLNTADYSLWGMDIDAGASEQLMNSTQYTAAGIFAVLPQGSLQLISGGKLAVLAYDSSLTNKLYVVIDPATHYSVVTKLESADQGAFSTSMMWTSNGLWSKGTSNRYMLWDLH